MKIFKNAWFSRFCRKENIPVDSLLDAVRRAESGQIDADLGGGVIKQRIARQGRGKSKGYRTVLLFRRGARAFFVFGFGKGERANISKDEEDHFKNMARHVLNLSDGQLDVLLARGQFEELESHDQKL